MAAKAHYVRNPKGAVHSVTAEHLDALKVGSDGKKVLPHGWEEVSEADAKKANPALFGE